MFYKPSTKMDMYSLTLLAAMIATGVAMAAAIARLFRTTDSLTSTTRGAGSLGILLAAGAIVIHFVTGHRPGTHDALSMTAFLAEHVAPLVTMLAGFVSVWLVTRRERPPTRLSFETLADRWKELP